MYRNRIIIGYNKGLLLYSKCRVATAPPAGEARALVLQACCGALDTVKDNFAKVGAQARLLHTWYLQVFPLLLKYNKHLTLNGGLCRINSCVGGLETYNRQAQTPRPRETSVWSIHVRGSNSATASST